MEEVDSRLVLIEHYVHRAGVILNGHDLVAHQFDGTLDDQRWREAKLLGNGSKPIGPGGGERQPKRHLALLVRGIFQCLYGHVLQIFERDVIEGVGRIVTHEGKGDWCERVTGRQYEDADCVPKRKTGETVGASTRSPRTLEAERLKKGNNRNICGAP